MSKPSSSDIAVHAYHLWEREGRPHGRDQDHWYRAEQEILGASTAAEDQPIGEIRSAQSAASPQPQAPRSTKKTAKPRTSQSSIRSQVQRSASPPDGNKSDSGTTRKPRAGGKQPTS